ncbi:hypothetical protein [Shewanella baltica]|uniref:hypothetical protein n=1 Tax=Shewanella baltica TaxID=62322 RepID=UPI000DFD558E|nr:hypothetical protein [Shewanella baltica]SUI53576.1 Uncharacterised protein [Shewanella baltica]
MNNEAFVNLIKKHSRDFTIDWAEGDNSGVTKEAQDWQSSLSIQEKAFLREIVTEALDNGIVNLLEIMDGVHPDNSCPIEASAGNNKISGQGCKQLHDLYAGKIEQVEACSPFGLDLRQ